MLVSRAFEINGTKQWIYIRLTLKPKGTLIFLHDGPGWADAPWAGAICRDIWSDFNTVHWDQRASNKSFSRHELMDRLTVPQLVDDGLKLISILQHDYNLRSLILVGHGFGSLLSLLMIEAQPYEFKACLNIGQFVSSDLSEPALLEHTKKKAEGLGKQDFVQELTALGKDFYKDPVKVLRQREILFLLSGQFKGMIPEKEFFEMTQFSPTEYQSKTALITTGFERSTMKLWNEILTYNLMDHPNILSETPFYLIQGSEDHFTPPEVVNTWFSSLNTKVKKKLIWFNRSGHWPHLEENKRFRDFLLKTF